MKSRLDHMKDTNTDMSERLKIEQQLTTQLAQETETIGEYITLYHQQRQTMNERLKEKDAIIERLQQAVNDSSSQRSFQLISDRWDTRVIPEYMQADRSFLEL